MKRHLLFGALLAALLVAVPAGASTFVALDDAALVRQADAVIIGEVLQTQSFWNEDMSVIVTEASIHVHDVLVGDAPAVITVRTFGGQVGQFHLVAHGFPTFEKGDTQALFVHRAEDGTLQVAGYRQGQFRVLRRADGVAVAVPALGDVRLLKADGTPAPRPMAQTLDAFKANVQALAVRGDRSPLEN